MVLSWPWVFRLCSLVDALPDLAEFERLFDDLFDSWISTESLQRTYPYFSAYLMAWITHAEANPSLVGTWFSEDNLAFPSDHIYGWNEDRRAMADTLACPDVYGRYWRSPSDWRDFDECLYLADDPLAESLLRDLGLLPSAIADPEGLTRAFNGGWGEVPTSYRLRSLLGYLDSSTHD